MGCIRQAEFPRNFVPLSKLSWPAVLALIGVNTVFLFLYRQLDYVASGHVRPPLLTFTEEAIGGLAGLAVFPLIYLAAIRFPLISPKYRLHLVVHLVAVCLISVVHTTTIALLRMMLLPPLGFGNESYGYMPARYPMEFAHLFIYYWVGLSGIYLFHEIRYARERELCQAQLESNLAEAQLQNLRLQLAPHFLFNALNAISAAIYENPGAADEMLGRLGELLRRQLKNDRAQVVSLAREFEFLQLYTSIMEARFEDRLTVTFAASDLAKRALVPQLILQPLVENAIRYGMNSHFEVRVIVEAKCDGAWLYLNVRDHGPGIDVSKPLKSGIGLGNCAERLERLYGKAQSLEIRNMNEGGAIVEIRIPFQMSDETVEPLTMARERVAG